jgi:hypothetical protein
MRLALFALIAAVTIWASPRRTRSSVPPGTSPAGTSTCTTGGTFDVSHPPLARIAFAFPLRHARSAAADINERISDVLASPGHYMDGVVLARRGNLLFLLLALLGLAVWAHDAFGMRVALIAVALFALLPPILAHAGLATTDIPVTAAVAAAAAVLVRWLRNPSWQWTVVMAAATGAGLLTKFSFPMFFGIVALTLMTAARRWPVARGAAAVTGAFAIVWTVYLFNRLSRFFRGLGVVMKHNAEGHAAYSWARCATRVGGSTSR